MHTSNKIEISKSSLLSLKAEVLRKQQEVNKFKLQTKLQPQTLLKTKGSKPSKPSDRKTKDEEQRTQNEAEDAELLEKSRKMLESKTKLYNRLVKRSSDLTEEEIEINKHYLVQFDRKTPDKEENAVSDEEKEYYSDEYDEPSNPDEQWVEYVDCLGRTRKCLRKDLEYLKEKDNELSQTLGPDGKRKEETPKWVIDTQGNKEIDDEKDEKEAGEITENSELLSSDMRKELLRQEWEKQEEALLNKRDVHYQDVLFNEARSHGVGYYAFSNDEEERAKQQKELKKLREETTQQQKATLEQRALREKQLSARLKAARNRKRARMGLPPEEDEPEQVAPTEVEVDEEAERKKAEKEAEEKAKEEARQRQVRPWDIGKEGVKKHYEHTQEEWVDKKRKERQKEFAPPTAYFREPKRNYEEEEVGETDKSLFFTTKKSKKPENAENENNDFWVDTSVPPPTFTTNIPTYESVNPYKHSESNYKNYQPNSSKSFKPTLIVNECIDFDEEQEKYEPGYEITDSDSSSDEEIRGKGTEIAPPPTFDYFGPNTTKKNIQNNSKQKQSLEESIAAGLKYLRQQAEKKEISAAKRSFL